MLVRVDRIENGRHGLFAFTHFVRWLKIEEGLETFRLKKGTTFSLNKKVWQEAYRPTGGTMVVLTGLYQKRKGWQADKARAYSPVDEFREDLRRK